MENISLAAEVALQLLVEGFGAELGNHAIQSEHVKYPSKHDALMALARTAYLKGRSDATAQPADFDVDVARVEAANTRKR